MAHAIFQTFLMTHFTSLHIHVGMRHTSVKMQAENASQGKWENASYVTKTGGLDYACTAKHMVQV